MPQYAIYAGEGGPILWLGEASTPRTAYDLYAQDIGYESWADISSIIDTSGTVIKVADASDRETWAAS